MTILENAAIAAAICAVIGVAAAFAVGFVRSIAGIIIDTAFAAKRKRRDKRLRDSLLARLQR